MKFIPCGKCDNGYIYSRTTKDGDAVVTRCDCYTTHLQKERTRQQLNVAGISESIIDYDIADYIGEDVLGNLRKINLILKKFEKVFRYEQLYFVGPNGTQKTTIAQYIGRELISRGFSVKYVLMNEMIKTLTREGFEDEVQSEIEKYYEVDCLIVDEAFDKEKILWYKSGYQLSFLDSLLRKRIDQLNKGTIFISNKKIETISDNFNQSIYDLIKRNTLNTVLFFNDHYSLKDDFDPKDLWK